MRCASDGRRGDRSVLVRPLPSVGFARMEIGYAVAGPGAGDTARANWNCCCSRAPYPDNS